MVKRQQKKEKKRERQKAGWEQAKEQEEIVKWNHTTALRFPPGEGGRASDIPCLPAGMKQDGTRQGKTWHNHPTPVHFIGIVFTSFVLCIFKLMVCG